MTTHRQIDEPAPTIVGPRPADGSGGRVSVPQGLERLLTLAGISAEWRVRVLADPLAAAAEADIGLSASEAAILKATPAGAIEQMCDSFARRHGRPVLGRAAAGVAAAALLATSLTGCGDDKRTPPTLGITSDMPTPRAAAPEVPPVKWLGSLDEALAEAKRTNRAVMAVFLRPWVVAVADRSLTGTEQKSQQVVVADGRASREAVSSTNLVAARVTKQRFDLPTTGSGMFEQELADKHRAAYEAALKKYGLDEDKLPAVVFLAPDGSELSKLVQPQEESALIAAIKAVPPLLARWIADQRKNEPPPPSSAGTRPPEYPR